VLEAMIGNEDIEAVEASEERFLGRSRGVE
jgi:hypothetical protein